MKPRTIKTVLVASDFSEASVRATELAFSIVANEGKVILLHVAKPSELVSPIHAPSGATITVLQARHKAGLIEERERLLSAVPVSAKSRDIMVEAEIVESGKVAQTILQSAAQCDANLICLGRHGHNRLTAAVLGSTTHEVVNNSTIAVLLAP
jgi:nucleotide-binding universal stress UspA family protein